MFRKLVLLLTCASAVVICLSAVATRAQETKKSAADAKAKTPLQKIMVKMEDQTKALRTVTSSAARFKKSGSGKDLVPITEDLIKLGKDSRKFTEPATTQKKPQAKWNEYTDQYIVAAEEMAKVVKKKDFQEIRKSLKNLDLSCSNCHGLFRPKTGGDDFGAP